MTMQSLKYPQEEFERRGQAWYEMRVRSQVDPIHQGEIGAIDVDTGEFELGKNTLSAAKRLLAHNSDSDCCQILLAPERSEDCGRRW